METAMTESPSENALPPGAESEMEPDAVPPRPEEVPEKFWDAETGTLRAEALLKSYRELERKLGTMVSLPADADDVEAQSRLREALGVPARADEYAIEPAHEVLRPDPELNARLHEAGFTQAQAQLVYDLAAERLLPLVDEIFDEAEAARQAESLAAHFGGQEKWQALARQLKTWGQANLPDETYRALASSHDGVLALHEMMRVREPSVLGGNDGAKPEPDEAELRSLMRDPRYWRDRDPALLAKVTEGFKRLYPS
jgi:hypothetical protein